jgi:hypothetical protein
MTDLFLVYPVSGRVVADLASLGDFHLRKVGRVYAIGTPARVRSAVVIGNLFSIIILLFYDLDTMCKHKS